MKLPPSLVIIKYKGIQNGNNKSKRKDEPKISKVLLTILDERFAKLLFTLKSTISWLNKKDISVP